ncbi:hypothetical protein L3X38_026313 [Prunus dulcis]|uniref:Uncharacterized protein n=1 Tax=Prunus dulcis TaxID=3755 RepID=A0AAD4UP95_PRUDU|nr:hypothetical protein L3X38_026313 [Prunus dulcis]
MSWVLSPSKISASIGTSAKAMVPLGGNCQPAVIDCQANTNEMKVSTRNGIASALPLASMKLLTKAEHA